MPDRTVIDCGYINPGGAEGLEKLVHTGAGRLLGLLVSSAQASAQTVTFYDDTTGKPGEEILAVAIPAGAGPFYAMFPREQGLAFTTGLYVEPADAEVAIWAVCYS
jgi:hypothetical protein